MFSPRNRYQGKAYALLVGTDGLTNMSKNAAKEIQFKVSEKAGTVSGLLLLPQGAKCLLILAHGAGAGMGHRFMQNTATKLAEETVALYVACPSEVTNVTVATRLLASRFPFSCLTNVVSDIPFSQFRRPELWP
jgi:hypothetical protein